MNYINSIFPNIHFSFQLSPIDRSILNLLHKIIMRTNLAYNYQFNYHTQKYSLRYILASILFVIKHATKWRILGSSYNNIYKHYIKLNKYGIFKNTYVEMLNKYLKKTNNRRLKCVYTDTTFIVNKYGIDSKKRNKYMKNKNCNKISIFVDNNNVPISFNIYSGNVNDARILYNELDNINPIIKKNIKYLCADKGYCSNKNRIKLLNSNIIPIIPFNKRNTKDKTKIKCLTCDEKKMRSLQEADLY